MSGVRAFMLVGMESPQAIIILFGASSSPGTEHVPVDKVLGVYFPSGEFGQDNFGSRLMDL